MADLLRTVGIAAGAIAAYELVRLVVVERLRRRLRNGAIQFVRRHHVKLESARFIDRLWLRERLA